jgi:DNA-binding NarL/FixJ family response regulator
MIKLFIIDDHHLISSGLKNEFRSGRDGISVAGCAQNLPEAIQMLKETEADIIVLDLWIKDNDPTDNINLLTSQFPKIPVVILTVEHSCFWQETMFRAGAKAYLFKSDSKSVMNNTFIEVARGMTVIPNFIFQSFIDDKSRKRSNATLTSEERELINEYCSGLVLKEIANKQGKSISSLEKKLRKIREKTNTKNIPELIKILLKRKEII